MVTHWSDHPRSRGVYSGLSTDQAVSAGSSPLARGLLDDVVAITVGDRIIPARAGFTSRPATSMWCTRDHPRSRGVYAVEENVRGDPRWIIPARAGFTPEGRRPLRMIADHPRSRGVYAVHIAVQPPHWGSSPLARGLRSVFGGPSDRDGIIPARAGFTTGPHCTCLPPWDHPRSRGVYVCSEPAEVGGPGSSPLARGLRRRRSRSRRGSGIIPARAGFTAVSPASPWKCGDHPRSRGVYGDIKRYMEAARGSSPLARGLPGRPVCWCLCMRIIPARAGFTGTPSTLRLLWRDHPRSRGVYKERFVESGPFPGSSPLARGLQTIDNSDGTVSRIIPARAGFTPEMPSANEARWDHPRSRGVYR